MLETFIKAGLTELKTQLQLQDHEIDTYTAYYLSLWEDGAVDGDFWIEILQDVKNFREWTTILTPEDVIWGKECQTFQDLINLKEEEGSLIFEYENAIIVHI